MSVYKGQQLVAGTPNISGKANTDMNNLTSTGKNITNWSSNVTNCITEIPQDIKLELENGVLTLKAGSKVYVPNGFEADGTTPKFDAVTISSDVAVSSPWIGPAEVCLTYRADSNELTFADVLRFTSGSTAPTETVVRYWYDTTNNIIKRYQYGSMTSDKWSFPLALLYKESSSNDTIIKSIDQVFNGFGYIGTTIYALPGVKGLIPNGRNANGTLNSTPFTIESVIMEMRSDYGTNTRTIKLGSSYISGMAIANYKYDEENNYNYESNNVRNYAILGRLTTNSNSITSFVMPTAFHTIDYYDCDGAFVVVNTEIVNGVSPNGSTDLEYTLSSLPNDGYDYECIITGTATTDSTSGHQNWLAIYTSLWPSGSWVSVCRVQTRTSSAMNGAGTATVIVPADRKLYLHRATSYYGSTGIWLAAYRRIGTNR